MQPVLDCRIYSQKLRWTEREPYPSSWHRLAQRVRQCPPACIAIKYIVTPLNPASYIYFAPESCWLWAHIAACCKAWKQGFGVILSAGRDPETWSLNLIILHFSHSGLSSFLLPSCLQWACVLPACQTSWNTPANIQAQEKHSHFKWFCPTDRWQQGRNVHETPPRPPKIAMLE